MTVSELHGRLIDVAALGELLANELIHHRSVHPNDRRKPELGAVVQLLAREIARVRDQAEAML